MPNQETYAEKKCRELAEAKAELEQLQIQPGSTVGVQADGRFSRHDNMMTAERLQGITTLKKRISVLQKECEEAE